MTRRKLNVDVVVHGFNIAYCRCAAAECIRGDFREGLVLREYGEELGTLGGKVGAQSGVDAGLVAASFGAAADGVVEGLTDLWTSAFAAAGWTALTTSEKCNDSRDGSTYCSIDLGIIQRMKVVIKERIVDGRSCAIWKSYPRFLIRHR